MSWRQVRLAAEVKPLWKQAWDVPETLVERLPSLLACCPPRSLNTGLFAASTH
jgi:hypothetical protein